MHQRLPIRARAPQQSIRASWWGVVGRAMEEGRAGPTERRPPLLKLCLSNHLNACHAQEDGPTARESERVSDTVATFYTPTY